VKGVYRAGRLLAVSKFPLVEAHDPMIRLRPVLACMLTAAATLAAATLSTRTEAAPPPPTAPQGAYGTIKGRLVWGGSEVPAPIPLKPNKDVEVCGKVPLFDVELVVDPKTKGVAHAFAYLPSPSGKNAELEKELVSAHPQVEIDQVNCEFVPISTALHKDQAILFKSSDPVGHNVHYTGFTNNGNFALGPKGSSEKKLAVEKRPMTLVCDIHPWMKGNIMVFGHPFFAVTGPDGSFEIRGVPAGTQNLVLWQRKAGYVTDGGNRGMAVTVKAGEVTDLGEIRLDPAKVKK
jgi:plastocyanin